MKKIYFYHKFFSIYIALVLQNVVTLSVNLTANIMLGAYGESALSGVTAVNQIQFVFQQLLLGLSDGLVIFGSQYWGRKEIGAMKKISGVAMYSGLFLAIVLFTLVTAFPQQAVGIFTTDEAIIKEGTEYLNIVRFTYIFFAVSQILLATLRMAAVVQIAFILSVVTFIVNCGLNYILIFGNFGVPEMGVAGSGIATLIARVIECGAVIVYVLFWDKEICIRLKDYFGFDIKMAKAYFKVALPILIAQGAWGLNTALQTVILGHMTAAAIAANSAASNLFLLVKSAASGAASTASVILGKAIGAGRIKQAKEYALEMQKLFVILGIGCGILLFFIRIPVLALYDLQPETKDMANTFLIILSLVCVGMSYQMPTNNGIIRGGGSTGFAVKLDLISTWIIVLPLSFFMAFVVEASPAIVVFCLNIDQLFKCIPAYLKCNKGNWIRVLATRS